MLGNGAFGASQLKSKRGVRRLKSIKGKDISFTVFL